MNNFYSFFIITVLAFGLISTPLTFAQSNQENPNNLGQEVSDFVHESRNSFEEQKQETKNVISECREELAEADPSDREEIREQCRSDLEDIRETYKSLRETYRETFLAFKEDMKVLIAEAKGLSVSSDEIQEAIENIEALSDSPDKKELLRELRQKITEELREEAHKLRELEKREREILREEFKAEQEELREKFQVERESLREQERLLREALKEAKDEMHDDDHDEDFIIKGVLELVNGITKILVDGTEIYVNENTEFDDFDSIDEIEGFYVKVEVIQSSNSLIAKEIEIEDDEDDDNRIEIEVEVEDGWTKIKVEYNGYEEEFELEGEFSELEAAAKILDKIPDFPYKQTEIMAMMDYEVEDDHDDDHDDDDEEP